MAQSSVAGRARIIVAEAAQGWRVRHGLSSGAQDKDGNIEHAIADHLASSGLLRTGLEERAVAACRARAKWPATFFEHEETFDDARRASEVVIAVGREILAAEVPKRWIASRVLDSQRWNVGKPDCHDGSLGSASFPLQFGTERDANLVAEALNKVEAR